MEKIICIVSYLLFLFIFLFAWFYKDFVYYYFSERDCEIKDEIGEGIFIVVPISIFEFISLFILSTFKIVKVSTGMYLLIILAFFLSLANKFIIPMIIEMHVAISYGLYFYTPKLVQKIFIDHDIVGAIIIILFWILLVIRVLKNNSYESFRSRYEVPSRKY